VSGQRGMHAAAGPPQMPPAARARRPPRRTHAACGCRADCRALHMLSTTAQHLQLLNISGCGALRVLAVEAPALRSLAASQARPPPAPAARAGAWPAGMAARLLSPAAHAHGCGGPVGLLRRHA
jgi:hypothetical protein